MTRPDYQRYVFATNVEGSKKASSYLRALDMLGEILSQSSGPFSSILSIWDLSSIETATSLYDYVLNQQKSGEIFQTDHAPSYWKNGYYSAALKSYRSFLVELHYEQQLLDAYRPDEFRPKDFEFEIPNKELLLPEGDSAVGNDVETVTKVRVGQNVFRRKVLTIYQNECCITGLNVPALNVASHILPWSERAASRLDPGNGLCLSGTYDLAFDKYLISLDEDNRVILSNELRDYFTRDVVKGYFNRYEGRKIQLPSQFVPKQQYLSVHRARMG